MKGFFEYLSLIPRGLKNADKVFEGIVNDIKLNHDSLPEHEKEEIIRRRLICSSCPFLSTNAKDSQEYFDLTGEHYKSWRDKKHCSMCGCPINKKTASLSSNCGIEVWNEEHPENKIELKWTKYNQ